MHRITCKNGSRDVTCHVTCITCHVTCIHRSYYTQNVFKSVSSLTTHMNHSYLCHHANPTPPKKTILGRQNNKSSPQKHMWCMYVCTHICMSAYVTHEPECVMSQNWVKSHRWMSHVTHMNDKILSHPSTPKKTYTHIIIYTRKISISG